MLSIRQTAALLIALYALPASGADGNEKFFFDPITTQVNVDYFGYFDDSPLQSEDDFFQGELVTTMRAGTQDRRWVATAALQLRAESDDKVTSGFEFIEDENTRPLATFKELTLGYFGDTWEVVAGKQTFNWSISDLFQPVNRFQAVDLLDVPTSEKIGQLSIAYRHHFDSVSIEAIVIPRAGPSHLPGPGNRWFNSSNLPFAGPIPAFTTIRELPSTTLNNWQYGLKLSSSTLLPGTDLTASYYRGFAPNGIIRPGSIFPTITIIQEYSEYQQYGGGFSTTHGDFEFHGEVVYHDTLDNAEDDDYLQYVVGFNYTLPESIIGPLDRIIWTVEYANEHVTHKQSTPTRFISAVYGRGLQNSILSEAIFEFNPDTRLTLGGAINLDDDDYSTRAELSHRFNDTLTVEAAVLFFSGESDTFFGSWDDNSRASVSAIFYF